MLSAKHNRYNLMARLATYSYIEITKLWSLLVVEEDNICYMDIGNVMYNGHQD